jgi:hypothetical protein
MSTCNGQRSSQLFCVHYSCNSRLALRVSWAALGASLNTVHTWTTHRRPTINGSCLYESTLYALISCTTRKRIHDWVVPRETVCDMHVARLSEPIGTNCTTHQLLCCGVTTKQWHLAKARKKQQSPGSFEIKLSEFFYRLLWMWSCKYCICFLCHFETIKLHYAHPVDQ